jgi:hypothetical protein
MSSALPTAGDALDDAFDGGGVLGDGSRSLIGPPLDAPV